MGNCQAAEVATVVVQHPGNTRVDRMYWSVTATEVMSSNPGYYVALVVEPTSNNNEQHVKNHLKLLRPEDTLHIGHVYRLISFEDVIKEFTMKKSMKLGKLLKGSGGVCVDMNTKNLGDCASDRNNTPTMGDYHDQQGGSGSSRCVGRTQSGTKQWRPALQSIAEI